uniref:CSON002112 protein n=1 Tax=Culicoides sonorensis TaxID=179676 RepID=A0A336LRK0_CULSO
MSFLPELHKIGEVPPKISTTSDFEVEQHSEEQIGQKIFKCPVCRSKFLYLASFIKSCGPHFPKISFDNIVESELCVENLLEPDQIKTEKEDVFNEDIEENSESDDSDFQSQDTISSDEETKTTTTKKGSRNKIKRIPPNTILGCPLCEKTFTRRQTYRDHVDAHENPYIKCCQICATVFSSGINANKHKKKFHPELYEKELSERTKDGRRKDRLPPILIPIHVKSGLNLCPKIKNIKVIINELYLPGFVKNDWLYLPKKEEIKNEPKINSNINQENSNKKSESSHDDWPESDNTDWIKSENIEIESGDLNQKETPIKEEKKSSTSYFIQQEEIPNVPKFVGSKYIFGVYSERRYKKLKEVKSKSCKKRGRPKRNKSSSEDGENENLMEENSNDTKSVNGEDSSPDFLKPVKSYYKSESKTCKICGVVRSNSNIRRHIAKHCLEEDDTECRICHVTFTAGNKLREHYSRVHKTKFREYLYKIQKEKMEQCPENQNNDQIKVHTCDICFTNLKTEDDLQYHIQMLHCYKEGGGKNRGSLDCNICGKVFAAVQNRNLHIRRVHKQVLDGSVFCHYCGKDFMGKGFLLSHFRYAHFDKKGRFKEASTVVKKRYKHPPKEAKTEDLANHYEKYKVHSVCEICGLIKESRFAMMRHRYEKHGVIDSGYSKIIDRDREENDCQYCGKHFTSVRKWKDHEKYHLKEIPNLHCQVCGAKCKTETYLKAHMERHGEKKFFCDYEGCGKGFAVKHDVKIHKRRAHCDDLDYVCKICGQAFRTWNYRRYHEETVHGLVKVKQQRNKRRPLPQVAAVLQHQSDPNQDTSDNNMSESSGANQVQSENGTHVQGTEINFNELSSLQEPEERDCQFCGKHFDDYRKWQNHEYYHKKIIPDLACDICGAKCKTEYYLKAHKERHAEVKHFCDYPGCGKGFSVKHDVKIHQRRAHKDLILPQQPQTGINQTNSTIFNVTESIPIVMPSSTQISPTVLYSYPSHQGIGP